MRLASSRLPDPPPEKTINDLKLVFRAGGLGETPWVHHPPDQAPENPAEGHHQHQSLSICLSIHLVCLRVGLPTLCYVSSVCGMWGLNGQPPLPADDDAAIDDAPPPLPHDTGQRYIWKASIPPPSPSHPPIQSQPTQHPPNLLGVAMRPLPLLPPACWGWHWILFTSAGP